MTAKRLALTVFLALLLCLSTAPFAQEQGAGGAELRGALSEDGVTIDPLTVQPGDAEQTWAPKAPAGAAVSPRNARIVSYAGKWTRHGLGNYMVWRYPNGPLVRRPPDDEIYLITQDVDVDGDGETADDYVASLPFRMDVPLSNPDWPFHCAFPERYSSNFYGGVTWMVGNSALRDARGRMNRFWVEMGYNPDHSPPWYDPRAEDHPLQGQAYERNPESVVKTFFVILWKKQDFLNQGDQYKITFDANSRLGSITARDYWLGYNDVRMIVQDGEALYISDNKAFDIPKMGYGRSNGRVFELHPTEATWAEYKPESYKLAFDAESARFANHDFKDVQAVGWYLAKDTLEGKQAHLKWYGFEADAVVNGPEQGSVHIEMAEVKPAGAHPFWMSTCEVPYALWRKIVRWGDSPFQTFEARYVYAKDGDMGSMARAQKVHTVDEPATNFTFYDALAWCNTLSELEDREPCYYVDPDFTEPFRNMHIATRAKAPEYTQRNLANPVIDTVPDPVVYVKWAADGYRLPTAGEWKVALGDVNGNAGWTGANADGATHDVGGKAANAAGMHDMIGNVWELLWTYGDAFDPAVQKTATVAGGGYQSPLDPNSAEAAASPYGDTAWDGNHNIGVRVVRRRGGLPAPDVAAVTVEAGVESAPVPMWTFQRDARTAAREKAGPVNGAVLDMVAIPEGKFVRRPDGTTITVSAFEMAKTHTTYAEWQRVYEWALANGYTFGRSGEMGNMIYFRFPHSPKEPVTRITWHDMLVWCNALSEMEGRTPCYYTDEECTQLYKNAFVWKPLKVSGEEMVREGGHRYSEYSNGVPQPWIFTRWDTDGYRLPTAAEFEYALRGGTDSAVPYGDDDPDDYVWSVRNSGGRTHPVGLKKPNGFGLYDMQGNVFDWVYGSSGHPPMRPAELDTVNPKVDPYWSWQQPKEVYSSRSNDVMLGASWLYGALNINGQHGVMANPQNSANNVMYYADLGFRVVRCEAGTHPRDGKEPLGEWPTVIEIDPENYNPLQR